MEFIQIGFGYVLGWLYELTRNYGVALILFTVVLKLKYSSVGRPVAALFGVLDG